MCNSTENNIFQGTSPCSSCPYRMDVKLKKWDINEYIGLLKSESDGFGKVYMCHKKNGTICKGFLMLQDKNRMPSIALRIELLKQKVNVSYLDSLKCESKMYSSVREMAETNYPELKKII